MNLIHQASELVPGDRKVCVAIGMFDGVHLGHQQVLHRTVADARAHGAVSVAITFDQHPNTVVAPERAPRLIYSLSKRLQAMASLGLETTFLIHFDRAFSEQSGEAFIERLARDLGRIQSIAIGENFTFGHKRSGNVTLLKALGRKLDFEVQDVPGVFSEGQMISSTRIRQCIQGGDLEGASQMLGRRYSVRGPVISGQQLGQKLGFPTANLEVSHLVLPPRGVYAGHAHAEGRTYQAVVNIGYRPTLGQPQPTLAFEVHLLDFTGELYNKELEFEVFAMLRQEEKFASLAALKDQIRKDASAARALLPAG